MKVGKLSKDSFSLDNYDEWYKDHAFGVQDNYAHADKSLERVAWIVSRVKPGSRVLDLGCLDGFTLITLAIKNKITGVGIDLSEMGISIAQSNSEDYDLPLKFIRQRIEDTDLKEKFDYVLCSEVLEHVKDVKELYRVIDMHLKPDGRVLLDTPDYDEPMGRANDDPLHIRYYTHRKDHPAEDAIDIAKEIGFERIIDMQVVDQLIQVEYGPK